MQGRKTPAARPERRPVSSRAVIDAAKRLVPTIDLADRLCGSGQLKRIGNEWVGRCPLPDHDDRVPSFTVNPEKDLWFCHGCLFGGDVVRLAQLVWNHDRADDAAGYLLAEFGYQNEILPRPEAWRAKQQRQREARLTLREARRQRLQRRVYRWVLAPALASITDEDERRDEAREAWTVAGLVAVRLTAHEKVAEEVKA
jgi:hypothetical protein